MRYFALACDYDGTLASHGRVSNETVQSLERVLESGRKLILVTGRRLDDLLEIFPQAGMFDRIVAENGALLYNPSRRREKLLADPPPPKFLEALRRRNVQPLDTGKVIVATWQPQETAVLEAVRETGLELHLIFNKTAVMVLPTGINKSSGMSAALSELELSLHNVVGVGDAENDHAFLSCCECSVAVCNALDAVKEHADIVTRGDHGRGVEELIEELVNDDLRSRKLPRHEILLGHEPGGKPVSLAPYGSAVLVAGPSGGGKSAVVTAILERLTRAEYQFCVVDPEGDYEGLEHAITLGSSNRPPLPGEVLQLISQFDNPVIDLLGVPMVDRPATAAQFLLNTLEFQERTGRPHWLILDEAHHLMPSAWHATPGALPQRFGSEILVTVHPEAVTRAVLAAVNVVIAVGSSPRKTLDAFSRATGLAPISIQDESLESSEAVVWFGARPAETLRVRIEPAEAERRRHRRKYAEGDLGDKSFHFRGPDEKLNLRAQNLTVFLQMAEGVDDDTWLHHLRQGDYSRWVRRAVKDETLARELQEIEQKGLPADESRKRVKAAVEGQYTGPA